MAEKERIVDCKERVAFDLMKDIAYEEGTPTGGDPRTYYLSLYRQCYLAVTGYNLDTIFEEVKSPKSQQRP